MPREGSRLPREGWGPTCRSSVMEGKGRALEGPIGTSNTRRSAGQIHRAQEINPASDSRSGQSRNEKGAESEDPTPF